MPDIVKAGEPPVLPAPDTGIYQSIMIEGVQFVVAERFPSALTKYIIIWNRSLQRFSPYAASCLRTESDITTTLLT
jgi:hypothetical protein